ncbi:MAG: hypothetical protein JJE27_06990, partial [Thermoleophilia bacterium]|nr:hypothetical protein [Thermoleophilia bacterium]
LIPSGALKDEQIRLVAGRLNVNESALAGLRNVRRSGPSAPAAEPASGQAFSEREKPERLFMASCLAAGATGREYLAKLTDDLVSTPLMRELRDHLRENFENPLAGVAALKPQLRDAVTEVAMLSERERASDKAIQLDFLQLEKAGLDRALAASPAGDKARIELKRQDVIKKLGELTAEFA